MKRGSTEVALLVLGLAASGCGGEEEASPPALVTNEVAVFVDDPEATWAGTGGSELSALLSFVWRDEASSWLARA